MAMTEPVYVDANVIVYALDPGTSFHAVSAGFWRSVAAGRVPAAVSPQVLHEAFVALTKHVGKPLDAESAAGLLADVLATPGLRLLAAGAAAAVDALRLAAVRGVRGPGIYDVAHVAVMREHGLRRIVTFNRRHFEGFEGIEPVEPPPNQP